MACTLYYFCKVRLVNRFIDILLYSSLFTACCALGLCMATERLINDVSPPVFNRLHLLVLGSTLLVYNTPKIIRKPYGRQRENHRYRGMYFFFLLAGLLITGAGLYRQSATVLEAAGILAVFAFAYFLPVLPFKNKKRLRDFGWLKITVLATVWTTATSILPMLYWQKSMLIYPFEVLLRFVFIFTLCVVFDIRDMQADLRNNIRTLPHKMGIKNSYLLIDISLALFTGLSIVQYYRHPIAGRLAGAVITAIVTWLVVKYLEKHPSSRAYLLLADGVMLFYALLVFLL